MFFRITFFTFFIFIFLLTSTVHAQYQSCPTNEVDIDGAYLIDDCCQLDRSNSTYRLKGSFSEKRGDECFLVDGGQNIELDMAGYTVTYDTGPIVEIANGSFENGSGSIASGWNFSNAPDAYRENNRIFYRFGEDYTLVFPQGISAQYVESDPVFLESGLEYRVQLLMKRMVDQVYIDIPQLSGECSSPEIGNGGTGTTWYSYACVFSVPSAMNVNVRIGVSGPPSETANIDMVEMRPEYTTLGAVFRAENGANNITLRNGTFRQGDAKTFGVYAGSPVVYFTNTLSPNVHDMTIIARGTQRIPLFFNSTTDGDIHDNLLIAEGTYGRRRDYLLPGLWLDQNNSHDNKVYNNNVNSFQTGIKFGGQRNEIYNNIINQNSYLTNAYGIAVRPMAEDIKVYGNTIQGAGRGMQLTRGTNIEVYNNNINLMEYPNPEYPNWESYTAGTCVHGIKLEIESTYNTSIHVHDNTVKGYQNAPGTFAGCPLNISVSEPNLTCNIVVENNEFITDTYRHDVRIGAPVAAYITGLDHPDGFEIKGNTFRSNSRGTIYAQNVYGFVFDSNTFINENVAIDPDTNQPYEHYFVHNTYGGTRERFADSFFLNTTAVNMDLTRPLSVGSGTWNYFVGWYLDINVENMSGNAIQGALVEVPRYTQSNFSQYTGPDGFFRLPLEEYEISGVGGTYSQDFYSGSNTSYSATVSYNGDSDTQNVVLNQQRSLTFTFSGTSSDTVAPSAINDLAVTGCDENSCTLSFSAPGDDGMSGTAQTYDIRFSTSLINESNFNSANQASGEPSPSAPFSSETFTVTGLNNSTLYYFAVKTYDDAGNLSDISNIVSHSTDTPGGEDNEPPVRFGASPSGILSQGTSQAVVSLNTDEIAQCRYALTSGYSFDAMSNTFTNTNSTAHTMNVTGLADGQSYSYFVRCSDVAGNFNTTDFIISFSISSGSDEYICGDVNADENINILDINFLIDYIYHGGNAPYPIIAGDVDNDGTITASDIVYLINYLFKDGPSPCNIPDDYIPIGRDWNEDQIQSFLGESSSTDDDINPDIIEESGSNGIKITGGCGLAHFNSDKFSIFTILFLLITIVLIRRYPTN